MKKQQSGFTLIELMIVVAIIGILASIALPAYQDYTKRAHVSEGLSLASAAKMGITEYYSDQGKWPDTNEKVGLDANMKGNAVSALKVTAGGVIEVTYNEKVATDAKLYIKPTLENGVFKWTCNDASNTVESAHLPSTCRGAASTTGG